MFVQIGDRVINMEHVVTIELGTVAKIRFLNGETVELAAKKARSLMQAFAPSGDAASGPALPLRILEA